MSHDLLEDGFICLGKRVGAMELARMAIAGMYFENLLADCVWDVSGREKSKAMLTFYGLTLRKNDVY